jgi:molybdopterin-containing oxidoreductase family iron-sulfur binding subunit
VFTQGSVEHQAAVGDNGNFKMEFLPISCQMCDNPACEKVCPTGATHTGGGGELLIDYEKCIGCRYCFAACPYGVRQFNWSDPKTAKIETMGYVSGYPLDCREGKAAHLVYTQNRHKGVAEKCSFCAQYTSEGELPACVRACPGKARFYGDLDDPTSEVSKLIATRQVYRLKEEFGTEPKVYYLSSGS